MLLDVTYVRIISALLMLCIASYTDIKQREIDDRIWMIFGGFSVVLLFFTPDISQYLVVAGFSLLVAPVVLFVWKTGFIGGADAFAIIVLAILVPGCTFSNSQINPFTTLINAVLLSTVPIVINVMKNVTSILKHENIFLGFEQETKRKKLIAVIFGYRAKNPKFGFSIEKKVGNLRKFDFTLKNADHTQFCSSTDTWITPGMPYMIYILGGFIVQLTYGDLIFNVIKIIH